MIRRQMLDAAEGLLRRHGPNKIALSDVAAACGMSQSNAYRFFASKQALLEAVGDRWFSDIEAELEQTVASDDPPAQKFVRFIARQYEMKRDRATQDRDLFASYLALSPVAAVERHLNRMRAQLEAIMEQCAAERLIGGRRAAEAAKLAEAMTVRFRDPVQILRHLEEDSTRLAAESAGIVLAGLANLQR